MPNADLIVNVVFNTVMAALTALTWWETRRLNRLKGISLCHHTAHLNAAAYVSLRPALVHLQMLYAD